jgi:MFS family permease
VLAGRLPRKKLINVVTIFFAACMVAFYLIGQAAGSSLTLALVFFLWIGIFNLMVIAQFWSFANDIYTTEEGERLFPIVAVGASAGAVVGSWLSGGVISAFGVLLPLLIAAGVLALSLVVTNWVDVRERRRKEVAGIPSILDTATMPAASTQLSLADIQKAIEEYDKLEAEREARGETAEPEREDDKTADRPAPGGPAPELTQTWQFAGKGEGPFKLVLKCRYLLLIALMILLLNWVNTLGEYILGGVVEDSAAAAVAAGGAGEDRARQRGLTLLLVRS